MHVQHRDACLLKTVLRSDRQSGRHAATPHRIARREIARSTATRGARPDVFTSPHAHTITKYSSTQTSTLSTPHGSLARRPRNRLNHTHHIQQACMRCFVPRFPTGTERRDSTRGGARGRSAHLPRLQPLHPNIAQPYRAPETAPRVTRIGCGDVSRLAPRSMSGSGEIDPSR